MLLPLKPLPTFDAMKAGALCSSCPLEGQRPVAPQPAGRRERLAVILNEYPDRESVSEGVPIGGRPGRLMDRIIEDCGLSKNSFHVTSALLCNPRRKLKPAEWKQALACCRPRLERELRGVGEAHLGDTSTNPPASPLAESADKSDVVTVVALGARAQETLTGKAQIQNWMGAPLSGVAWVEKRVWKPTRRSSSPPETAVDFRHVKLISMLHPGFCLREPAYTPTLRIMFERAVDLARGKLPEWQWPAIVTSHENSVDEVNAALRQLLNENRIGCDVETYNPDDSVKGPNPMGAVLLDVGVAGAKLAVSVYWPDALPSTKDLLAALLSAPHISKDFWNFQHDIPVLENHGLALGGRCDDWMLAHHVAAPRVRHGLSHVSAYETHAPRWKTAFHEKEK